jgi:hypothetical protein
VNRDADIALAHVAPADVLDGTDGARAPRIGLRDVGRSIARLSDGQLASLISLALFAFSAWPLLLVEVPPLQDLPNHIASVTVLENPSKYPEFVSNGFFKTNTAVFAWLVFAGRALGINLAAKAFKDVRFTVLISLINSIFSKSKPFLSNRDPVESDIPTTFAPNSKHFSAAKVATLPDPEMTTRFPLRLPPACSNMFCAK